MLRLSRATSLADRGVHIGHGYVLRLSTATVGSLRRQSTQAVYVGSLRRVHIRQGCVLRLSTATESMQNTRGFVAASIESGRVHL